MVKTARRQVRVIRKSDGMIKEYASISEASRDLNVPRDTIRRSIMNPFHYSHTYGHRKNKDGSYSIFAKYIDYDFELIEDTHILELWCTSDGSLPPFRASSISKAVNMLGCSKSTFYARWNATEVEETSKPIIDREGREWVLVPLNKVRPEFKSNIKKLQH